MLQSLRLFLVETGRATADNNGEHLFLIETGQATGDDNGEHLFLVETGPATADDNGEHLFLVETGPATAVNNDEHRLCRVVHRNGDYLCYTHCDELVDYSDLGGMSLFQVPERRRLVLFDLHDLVYRFLIT